MVRFKNRYFLCEVCEYDPSLMLQALNTSILAKEIKEQIGINFGDMGAAKTQFSLQVKYFNPLSRIFILRVARDHKNLVWTSLAMMNELSGQRVQIRILACTGTTKKCEIKARWLLQTWVHKMLKSNAVADKVKEILESDFKKSIEAIGQIEF